MQTTKIIEHILKWLNNYLKKSNLNGFIVAISGGIDSAVTSTLTAKTGKPTLLLEMPIHQNIDQLKCSNEHVNILKKNFNNIDSLKIDLTNTFDNFCKTINDIGNNNTLALANVKSRLRMVTIYYYSNKYNYLVTGTGNKIEDFGVGFFTKYGDGGVDINPLADLYKSDIYTIAKKLKISKSIIKAEPTDGLWGDNRSDKDQLGFSYEDLEWAMKKLEKSKNINNNFFNKKILIDKFLILNKKSKHKNKLIPICKIPDYLKQ